MPVYTQPSLSQALQEHIPQALFRLLRLLQKLHKAHILHRTHRRAVLKERALHLYLYRICLLQPLPAFRIRAYFQYAFRDLQIPSSVPLYSRF